MTIPWFVAVQIATQGEFMREAIDVDLAPKMVSAAEGHKGLPGMHLAALPILFWPGTLLLVPGAVAGGLEPAAHEEEHELPESGARRSRGTRVSAGLAVPGVLGGAVVDRVRTRADQALPLRAADVSRLSPLMAGGGSGQMVRHERAEQGALDLARSVHRS